MSKDSELVRGSGNVFRDFGRADAGAEQLKALLAAEIVGCLDRRRLTAQETGSRSPRPISPASGRPGSIGSRSIA